MVSDRVDARVRGGVRGRIGLQLCDANTGRVVAAVERENYVAQRMLDVPAEFARFGIVGVENPNSASAATWMPTDGAFLTAPFTGLVLTDFDGEIDLNERGIGGTVTGYASKGVSGQGDRRGTYNALESEHRFDYHRFVYDFATTEANGTIQSIYTGPWNAASSIQYGAPEGRVPATRNYSGGTAASNLKIDYDPLSGAVYRAVAQGLNANSNNSQVNKADLLAVLSEGVRADVWTPETLPTGDYSALAVVGTRLYWLDRLRGTGASRTLAVYSAPVTDLQNHRLEHTWNAAFLTSIGWTDNSNPLRGFTWMPDRETFILGNISTSASHPSAALYEFDPNDNWELLRAFDGPRDAANSALSALPGSADEIMCGDTVGRLHNLAGEITRQGTIQFTTAGNSRFTTEVSQGMGISVVALGSGGVGGQSAAGPVQQFFSRARLDEPVVKTSTLTMKITYEFTFDPPVWLP